MLISVFAYFSLYASADFHPVSLIYGVLWALLFALPVIALPRIPSHAFFIASCTLFSVYGMAEHIYYRCFNKLFSFTVISKTSEDGCTEETIMYMTEYTYRRIKINDLILSSDYYGRK